MLVLVGIYSPRMATLMAARSQGNAKKNLKALYVELSEDLSLDLAAFCKAHYNAPQIEVIREALQEHINGRLAAEEALRRRFHSARESLRRQNAEPIHLIDKPARSAKSGSPGTPETSTEE
jgi:hypothetical protein